MTGRVVLLALLKSGFSPAGEGPRTRRWGGGAVAVLAEADPGPGQALKRWWRRASGSVAFGGGGGGRRPLGRPRRIPTREGGIGRFGAGPGHSGVLCLPDGHGARTYFRACSGEPAIDARPRARRHPWKPPSAVEGLTTAICTTSRSFPPYPPGTAIRLLFVFDPSREAVVLVAGDKAGSWNRWYREAVPLAEKRYAEYREATS
ncbi:type II toxin-antitoxin system RelE/ParE family toxin [Nocardiopsis halophila]|uniref:type II toxin-antitoxin system RelE/ParE family toxin n=1 Tax=Nocardiopsis halophila TaxID=141692 RepID=UPI00373AE15D